MALRSRPVCVTASLSEGCSNVIIEAMAAGKPSLASDIPTHREMLTRIAPDFSSKCGDAASIARQITRMFDEGPALSHNAFAACRHFALGAMIDGYERVFGWRLSRVRGPRWPFARATRKLPA